MDFDFMQGTPFLLSLACGALFVLLLVVGAVLLILRLARPRKGPPYRP